MVCYTQHMMGSHFEMVKNVSTPDNLGVEKLFTFLKRIGFEGVIKNQAQFKEWLENVSFEEFQEHLIRINGIIREIPISKREIDGGKVFVGSEIGIEFLPPDDADKNELLKYVFEKLKDIPNIQDQGLLLYLSIQYLHLFKDGNGRLGRLLYYIIRKVQESSNLDINEMRELLCHDGETGKGREIFYSEVIPPANITNIVNQIVVKDLLSKEFLRENRRPFSGLEAEFKVENNILSAGLKKSLEKILAETGGRFSFRDIIMVKYLENHRLLEEYKITLDETGMDEKMRALQKTIYRYDAERLLSDISETEGNEILEISRNLKRKFIQKMVDIIAFPEKYSVDEQKTVKDLFYSKKISEINKS